MVQNIKFSLVGQNNDLSLKLNPNNKQESIVMLNFQNRALDLKILKFHANRNNSAYPEKNVIFNGSSFTNSENTIGFFVLKRVQLWSQILISSLDFSSMQNKANFN